MLFLSMLALALSTDVAKAQPAGSYPFQIPPQPLDSALKAFATATNLLLSYEATLTAGRVSPGVSGVYTPDEGLRLLLEGTVLQHRFANDNTVTLIQNGPPPVLPPAGPLM